MVDEKLSGDEKVVMKIVMELKESGVIMIIVVVGDDIDFNYLKNILLIFGNVVNISIIEKLDEVGKEIIDKIGKEVVVSILLGKWFYCVI